jgi:hypothetical protein
MFKPEEIPTELPQEVKSLLDMLRPEPPMLVDKRKRLLAELDTQSASAKGALQQVLHKLRAVLQAMQPQVPFQAGLTEEFARALERYGKDPTAPKQLPALLVECIGYLQERVEAMGLGSLLTAVQAASEQARAEHTPG